MESLDRLCDGLAKLGISTIQPGSGEESEGFLCEVKLPDGNAFFLDLSEPALVSWLDPEALGVAILNSSGNTLKTWGIARQIAFFDKDKNVLESDIATLVLGAYRGNQGSLFLDGFRYFAGGVEINGTSQIVLLVADAHEEEALHRTSQKFEFEARALRKVGKALTMNQTLEPICYAAVHEIASVAELAAALLWVQSSPGEPYELKASIGANRNGTSMLAQLHDGGASSCVAELVIGKKETLIVRQAGEHVMTRDLEAKFCYLKPGGVVVIPLVIGDRLVGVLELIARDADSAFLERKELFETIAEHLSLALNSALMFESFERLATIDPLTGVANHRAMQEFLHRRLYEAERSGQEMGLIMLDVDHFRAFNEEEGHDTGDLVLKKVVDAMKSAIRPYDLAARYGGEEFTVILPNSGIEASMHVAERIRSRIEAVELVTASGAKRHVTASLGISIYPTSSREPQSLLKAADIALYDAKAAGRNRCVAFEGEFTPERAQVVRPIDLSRWLTDGLKEMSDTLWEHLGVYAEFVCAQLGLSSGQRQILESLIRISPAFLHARDSGDTKVIADMDKNSDIRSLMPALHALDERFDGTGPHGLAGTKIPLLSRILSALLHLIQSQGQDLLDDPNRFDPEIVAMIGEFPRAA